VYFSGGFFIAVLRKVKPVPWEINDLERVVSTKNQTDFKPVKLHSKRVEKMSNYTRNEWRRCQTTLETSGEDVKLHSKRVEKM
jgi:hypothetical protein